MLAPDEFIAGRWASEMIAALPRRVCDPVRAWAERTPDAPALFEAGACWSYAELAEAVAATRARLLEWGVRPGDRIMVVNENSRALACLFLAASELDVWVAIINARLADDEIDTIAAHCEPVREFYTVAVSSDAARHAERRGAETVADPWLGEVAVTPHREAEARPVHESGAEQVAALIYTSGTTGVPKGVMLSHRGLSYVAAVSGALRDIKPGARLYGVLPASHVYGLASVLLGSLHNGACLHMVPRFDPAETYRALAKDGITVLQGVPAMYARLLEYMETQGLSLHAPHLSYMSVGGAPLDLGLKQRVEAATGLTLHNGYGLTESSPTISQTRIEAPRSDCSVGKILPGLEARVVTVDGDDAQPGEIGELWVRGPSIMLGYFKNPEATAATVDPEGWLNTGDLATLDDGGYLTIAGRSKELIIRSGFNVYPPDVEAVLNQHPEVTLSAVVGRTVPGNEEVVAYIQPVPGSKVTVEDIRQFAKERLAGYKRPSHIILMESLPATATGKILKGKLKQAAQLLPDST